MHSSSGKIYLSPPHLSGQEEMMVQEAIKSNWIAPEGPQLDAFEGELAKWLGVERILALNSGTSALHLALKLMGVGPGDVVIAPTFTFCAVINPIFYLGASPLLIDCEEESWGLDPILLEKCVKNELRTGGKPKAIILVHNYGMPANVSEIREIATHYDIPVIEDAAESIGSKFNDKLTGTFGDLSIFSFNGNKTLTTGGGGGLVCRDSETYERALKLATQSKENKPYYHHEEVGFNYRMNNLTAAVGLGQMIHLEERISRKRLVFEWYRERIQHVAVSFQEERKDYLSNRWLTTICLHPDKTTLTNLRLSEILKSHDIESRIVWQPLHFQPAYHKARTMVNGVSERLFSTGICLPSGSNLTENEVERITGVIIKAL